MNRSNDTMILYYRAAFFATFDGNQRDPLILRGVIRRSSDVQIEPKLKIWNKHPADPSIAFDVCLAFPIDPLLTPGRVLDWTKTPVDIDDHTHGLDDRTHDSAFGFTTLGPIFPHAYGAAGVYVSQDKYQEIAAAEANLSKEAGVGDGANQASTNTGTIPCDETAIVRRKFSNDPHGPFLRYHGFKGRQLIPTSNFVTPDLIPRNSRKNNHFGLWLVYHPGTYTTQDWRPPRTLFINDEGIIYDYIIYVDAIDGVDTTDAIYIEQDYATYVAQLDVPKQPSGSGERGAVVKSDKPPIATARSLNVMGASITGELKAIYPKLDTCILLQEGETLVDALSRFLDTLPSKNTPQFEYLDLIGHSRSRDKILKIGEFAITSRVADEQFSRLSDLGILSQLGIQHIRLLGCRTATTSRGQRTVRTIRNYFPNLKVYAARGDLFAVHYDASGLSIAAEVLLAEAEVITADGPGDNPPRDDYPADPPNDDDDDDDDDNPQPSGRTTPNSFSIATLSALNSATVSPKRGYLFWRAAGDHFDELVERLYADIPVEDNTLRRADVEIIMTISLYPSKIGDFRCFDLIISDERPRVRIYQNGAAYAFLFRPFAKSLTIADVLNNLELSAAPIVPPNQYPT